MTFQQLYYMVQVSKCGSINKAAKKLFISQSAVSAAVRELEEELGATFLIRSNRGVEFTPEGKEFLSYAVSLLGQKRRLESLYTEADNGTVPTSFSVSSQRFPFSEAAFLRLLQESSDNRLRFSYKEDGMDAVIDDVYDHRADVGVIFTTASTERIILRVLESRGVEFSELAAVPPCAYMRCGHPLSGRAFVSESELNDYPYISFELEQGVAADFFEEYPINTLSKPAKCIRLKNRSVAMHILERTDAVTTGSGLLARDLGYGNVMTVPLQDNGLIRIGSLHIKSSRLSAQAQKYLSLLTDSIADSVKYSEELRRRFRSE